MNLLLFRQDECGDDGRVSLTDYRLQHLHEVIESSEGDSLRVGEIGGQMGRGEIIKLSDDEAILEVALDQPPPDKLPLHLILALPRPKMLRRILRMVAELGVEQIHLVNSYRVEKSYWQTPVLDAEVVEDYFLQGLAQSRDTVLPQLHMHRRFKPFVEDTLPELIKDRRSIAAHPGDYASCPTDLQQPTTLAIGPEGGFIPYEIEKLEAIGFDTVSLGPRILRVENAVATLVARLSS